MGHNNNTDHQGLNWSEVKLEDSTTPEYLAREDRALVYLSTRANDAHDLLNLVEHLGLTSALQRRNNESTP